MANRGDATKVATFGGGCFWCTEAIFQQLRGVERVVSGYAGGMRENPAYEQVSTGATGHAEVVHITFDPTQISFETLLDVFWSTHDPTTLNQQGADVGTQYRSVIFYHDDTQKSSSEFKKQELEALEVYKNPVVTEILPFKHFSPAEERHQDYYQNNPNAPYCQIVISPKLQKLTEKYSKILK